jgi:hypothetical protein
VCVCWVLSLKNAHLEGADQPRVQCSSVVRVGAVQLARALLYHGALAVGHMAGGGQQQQDEEEKERVFVLIG